MQIIEWGEWIVTIYRHFGGQQLSLSQNMNKDPMWNLGTGLQRSIKKLGSWFIKEMDPPSRQLESVMICQNIFSRTWIALEYPPSYEGPLLNDVLRSNRWKHNVRWQHMSRLKKYYCKTELISFVFDSTSRRSEKRLKAQVSITLFRSLPGQY